MKARIFRKPRSMMQAGAGATREWVLEYEPAGPREPDPLMGWIGGSDTRSQVQLLFASEAEAIAFAGREGIAFEVEAPNDKRFKPKAYADNFRFGRHQNWTH